MYSIHNKGKSVVAERFIRTLKTKIHKHMTSVSKNVYMDKLDDIVNEYNNTYHRKIKIKPVLEFSIEFSINCTIVKKLMIMIINLKLVII